MLRAVTRQGSAVRPRARPWGLVLWAMLAAGCIAGEPPLHWARGGAPLDLPRARWTFGETVVEIGGDGRIKFNGSPLFTLDSAGRVFDGDATPLALLERDGRVVGPDEANLGVVGIASASLPGEKRAWLAVAPSGEVVRFDDDGQRHPFGTWVGECNRSASSAEVCTLVTHLLGLRLRGHGVGSSGVSIGVGVGVVAH
jgi:hypothetical protein